jgi:hypothetical protein
MTGRLNGVHAGEKLRLTLERPDVLPSRHCGLNALRKLITATLKLGDNSENTIQLPQLELGRSLDD